MVEYYSSLSYSKKGHGRSLKTTVPTAIVGLLSVDAGDKLTWGYDTESKIFTVRKKR